ncbi:hypothetical protein ACU8V3_12775 [Cobetia marina]
MANPIRTEVAESAPGVPFDLAQVAVIEQFGGSITPLEPIGAEVRGIDLSAQDAPPAPVLETLEKIMAERGFLGLQVRYAPGGR